MKKFYLLVTLVVFGFFSMKAQIEAPENLHVSPTGWAQWVSNANPEQPEYGETFSYSFNQSISGWTQIDADGDGNKWSLEFTPSELTNPQDCCAASFSWNGSTLHPDNYLVSKQVMLGQKSQLTYMVTSQQNGYLDHYGIAISTASPTNPDDFTVVFHETASYGWQTKTIDLGEYAGRLVYIAFRHYNSSDKYRVNICNVELGNSAKKDFIGFNIKLDDQVVAQNVENTYYQFETANLVEGQTYTTSVQTVFDEGQSEWTTCEWIYAACDNYEGYESVEVENVGNNVMVSWDMEELEGTYLHYDDGTNIEGIGLMAGTPIYWAIHITADDLTPYINYRATKIAMFDYEGHRGKIMIYQGDETTPENLLYTQDYTTTGCGQYIDIPLDEYVAIDNTRGVWFVMLSLTGNYPAPIGPNTGEPYGRLYSDNGTDWYDLANNGIDNSFNLRGYIEENNGVLGTMVFRDGVCLTPKPVKTNAFLDESAKQEYEYCIRKVYSYDVNDAERFAMSCPTCATIEDVVEVTENGIGVYPNPASDVITIEGVEVNDVVIYNSLGQMVEVLDATQNVDVRNYTSGIYMMVINGNENVRFVVR